jgi:hypothetical protein
MCCTSSGVEEHDDMLWNGRQEDGNVRSMGKINALTMKMETVTLLGKDR